MRPLSKDDTIILQHINEALFLQHNISDALAWAKSWKESYAGICTQCKAIGNLYAEPLQYNKPLCKYCLLDRAFGEAVKNCGDEEL